MIEPGRLRSARQNHGPLGSGIVGPHHAPALRPGAAPPPASPIRPVSAPAAPPARMPSPALNCEPVVQSTEVGCGWYFSRSSRFFSNPPLPRMTPRPAGPTDSTPARAARAAHAQDADAGDAAVLDDEVGELGLVVDGDAGVEQALAQPDRDRVAHRE